MCGDGLPAHKKKIGYGSVDYNHDVRKEDYNIITTTLKRERNSVWMKGMSLGGQLNLLSLLCVHLFGNRSRLISYQYSKRKGTHALIVLSAPPVINLVPV